MFLGAAARGQADSADSQIFLLAAEAYTTEEKT
jgi:hypothetical protein